MWRALLPIDTRNINDHINHVTAKLVRLHVHRGAGRRRRRNMSSGGIKIMLMCSPVSGNVDLAHHIKQESFLNARVLCGIVPT